VARCPASTTQEPQEYATPPKVSSTSWIQAPAHILLGCNRSSRCIYGDVSANNEQAAAAMAGGCTAEPSGDIARCGRFTLPHCSFSTFCVCLQCYLNARWELVIGVPRITHSWLGFVAALAWAFANFTLLSCLGCDPCMAKSLWPTRAQWPKPTKE
jgi:hypothetical protein